MHSDTSDPVSRGYSSLGRRAGGFIKPSGAVYRSKCSDHGNLSVAERHKDAHGSHLGSSGFEHSNRIFLILVQFPWEINRPSEVQSSRFPRNSATLRPLKVEAGINGLLPTSWVPSIYSVSLLIRHRYALER